MNRWTLVGTFGGVVHTGTEKECELIRDAMAKYGISKHKLEILPIEGPTLSKEVRDELIEWLVDRECEVLYDEDVRDMVYHGTTGYKDYTDQELFECYEQFDDGDENNEDYADLLAEAKAQLVIQDVLADDHEEKMEECYKIAEEEGF